MYGEEKKKGREGRVSAEAVSLMLIQRTLFFETLDTSSIFMVLL